jgi:hypothetical protein
MVVSMAPLRAGFLEYEQTNALDLIGPAEAFASAFRDNGRVKFKRCYEVLKYRPDAESGFAYQTSQAAEIDAS